MEVRDILVELVDASGEPVGVAPKLAAHVSPGSLHRAVSVLLLDGEGRLIVQRRARDKYHSAGRWSNTCCGHPEPGERPEACARRRLGAELGLIVPASALVPAGVVTYRHPDPVSGLVEHEYDHLYVGIARDTPAPDPAEVEAVAVVDLGAPSPRDLEQDGFTGWYRIVVAAAMPALERLRDGANATARS